MKPALRLPSSAFCLPFLALALALAPAVHAVSAAVRVGQALSLVCTANGPNLTYQWQKNGVAISGATEATLVIASFAAEDAATYACIVSNNAGTITSDDGVLIVLTPSPARVNLTRSGSQL